MKQRYGYNFKNDLIQITLNLNNIREIQQNFIHFFQFVFSKINDKKI